MKEKEKDKKSFTLINCMQHTERARFWLINDLQLSLSIITSSNCSSLTRFTNLYTLVKLTWKISAGSFSIEWVPLKKYVALRRPNVCYFYLILHRK